MPVSDLWGIQGLWNAIYAARRLSVLDQSVSARRGLSIYGSDTAARGSSPCHGDRFPGRIWRACDRPGTLSWNSGQDRQRIWRDLYAHIALLFQLSRSSRRFLAILRWFARPFRARDVLFDVHRRSK